MLKCHQATRLMSEAQERPLNAREKLSLRMHTLMCAACHHFQQQLPVLRRLSQAYTKRK
ncbi:zf-HC2 domain-containing protein [Oceanimonas smirnovii]|uniref:zf-HC2 domain-containing protein n=1 Tax=Oceanimonas smirnovii TaxID=264574 RepID=UPI00036B5B7A|nr:zf-HC2 domain-containing protein [Oceanimonas smirnovii]